MWDKILNIFLMLMVRNVCKMVEIHHTKKLNYIINIYFKVSKNLDKVYNDLKDKLKFLK